MKHLFSPLNSTLALLCLLALHHSSLLAADSEQPKPGPETKKLEMFVGEWKYEGLGHACPFGPAGKFSGKGTDKMILNGFFLESRWKDVTKDGFVAEGLVLHWYDPVARFYRESGFDFDGAATSNTLKHEGNTWTSTGTRTDKAGKVYQTKFVATFSADGRTIKSLAEYSGDEGKTWQPWYELTSKKVSK